MESTSISEGLLECFRIPEVAFLANRSVKFADVIAQHRGIEMSVFMIIAFVLSLTINKQEFSHPLQVVR